MAGHEKSGPAFASAWMFRGARWLLTPTSHTGSDCLATIESLIAAMGAVPVRVDAQTHDRQVAILSHVPHALAAVLVVLGEELPRTDLAGGSWKDLTRVGGVDPDLWSQILIGNRSEIANVLGAAVKHLESLRASLLANNLDEVRAILTRARKAKKKQET